MINENIHFNEVLLIGSDGSQLGVMSSTQALDIAREQGYDLVCVAPQAKTPVCRLIDYQKYRFEQQKRARLAKKNQTIISIKEIRLSPVIGDNDFERLLKQGIEFLEAGNKLKVTLSFSGRARMLGSGDPAIFEVMERYIAKVGDIATVESKPTLEGRNMSAMLALKKKK